MKFIPVSETEFKAIVELFNSDLGIQTIMQKFERDFYTIKKIWLTTFNEKQCKARASRLCRLHKIGVKNPMYGKTKEKHHNAVLKEKKKSGYIQVFAPDWYKGRKDYNKVYEHIVVYCEYNGLAKIPDGKVVHHLNSNPEDNSPDNLILLSIADHRRIHAWLNKVQRLEDTLVENSVLEVHDTPKG